jgi:hypothetical protein
MKKTVYCNDRRCSGKLDFENSISVTIDRKSEYKASPCRKCGLLHTQKNGVFINFFEKDSRRMAFLEEGKLVFK